MIPRAPASGTATANQPPQQQQQQNKNSMLDKLKLFKNSDRPVSGTNGKRTSSSSGVSSARSERSDSSASLEPNSELKSNKGNARTKQQRSVKAAPAKISPNLSKKEIGPVKQTKIPQEVEKQSGKVPASSAASSKLGEPKIKISSSKTDIKAQAVPLQTSGTGIPKPTAAVKGTSKVPRDDKANKMKSPSLISRECSQTSMSGSKPAVALVSPMKNEKDNQLSESSHSASTGQHSNSSESSVIYKPSSESGSDHHNVIPNRKDPPSYISEEVRAKEKPEAVETIPEEKILNVRSPYRDATQNNDEDALSMNIQPMQPLLRGYCSSTTLPSRSRHCPRIHAESSNVPDYCEISLLNGYLSDGDVLRYPHGNDLCDGYMSEGGVALYSRRVQGMPTLLTNG